MNIITFRIQFQSKTYYYVQQSSNKMHFYNMFDVCVVRPFHSKKEKLRIPIYMKIGKLSFAFSSLLPNYYYYY